MAFTTSRSRSSHRFSSRAVQFEALEARALLSASLIADVTAGGSASNPESLIDVNGTLFFTTNPGNNVFCLYRSDGTAAGTKLVTQLPAQPISTAVLNDRLFFAAGNSLWTSDGTAAGTMAVKSVTGIGRVIVVGNTLFFVQDDVTGAVRLWKSDGTAAGTVAVKQVATSTDTADDNHLLTDVNGTLFFMTSGGSGSYQVWKSDGTAEGTVPLVTFSPQSAGSLSPPSEMAAADGTLYFSATDVDHGSELWRSDGTPGGTTLVADLRSPGSSSPRRLTPFKGGLLFIATNQSGGIRLYRSDGTADGTVPLGTVSNPVTADDYIGVYGGYAYLGSLLSPYGKELVRTDGSAAPSLVKDIEPNGDSSPGAFVDVNGTLFFTAQRGADGRELWQTDGTSDGTVRVGDIRPGTLSSNPAHLTNVNGTLFFTANDGAHGVELWKATTPQAAPLSAAATAVSDTRVDLSWGYPGEYNTGFIIERSTDGVNYAQVGTVSDPTATGFSDTASLSPSTRYYYRVRATTAAGPSVPSNIAAATTQPLIPLPPGNLAAAPKDGSTTSIRLTWADYSGNETGFKVERSADGQTFEQVAAVGADVTTYEDDSLAPASSYVYRVRATNGHGDSDYSGQASATTLTPESPFTGGPFAVPGLVQAEDFDNGSRTVSYFSSSPGNSGGDYRPGAAIGIQGLAGPGEYAVSAPAGTWLKYTLNFAPAAAYNLEMRLAMGPGGGQFHLEVDGVDKTGTLNVPDVGNYGFLTYTFGGLSLPAGQHVLRVSFDTAGGPGGGTPNSGFRVDWLRLLDASTVTSPAAAAGVAAFALNGPSVDLTWTDTATETSYRVYRKADGDAAYSQVGWVDANVTRFSDSGVLPLTGYSYYVLAANSAGDAPPGTAAAVTTLDTPARQVTTTLPNYDNSTDAMADISGVVYFTSSQGSTWRYDSARLWRSDGTTAGTVPVPSAPVGAYRPSSVGGRLLFVAPDAGGQTEALWTIDAATGGAVEVKDLGQPVPSPGQTTYSIPDVSAMTDVNGIAYFVEAGRLWKSDGAPAGTAPVANVPTPGSIYGTNVFEGANVNGSLFFTVTRDSDRTLWKSDGTAAGTTMVRSFFGASGYGRQDWLTSYNGSAYFGADGYLWRSDGTADGTYPVVQVDSLRLTVAAGKLFFYGLDASLPSNQRVGMYTSDGTTAGSRRVLTLPVDTVFPVTAGQIIPFNNSAYFTNGSSGAQWSASSVWKSDGTAPGTMQVSLSTAPYQLTAVDGALMFASQSGILSSDGTAAASPVVTQSNLAPQLLTRSAGRLFFAAPSGSQIWTAHAPPAAPAARVTATGPSSVSIAWAAVSPVASPISAFVVERRAGISGPYVPIGDLPATASSFTDTTATSGPVYFYRVRAANAGGSTASAGVAPVEGVTAGVGTAVSVTDSPAGPVLTITGTASETGGGAGSNGVSVDTDLSARYPGISVNVGGGAAVVFAASQHLAGLTLGGGATATLASVGGGRTAANHRILVTGGLSIDAASGSRLDLADNDLVLRGGGAAGLASVQSLIKGGYGSGAWDGNGITSSVAALAENRLIRGLGFLLNDGSPGSPVHTATKSTFGPNDEPVAGTDVLVKYTYRGDTDLNGQVDPPDYFYIDKSFPKATGSTWGLGDFDYNGSVDPNDYFYIDRNFSKSGL